jgi:hypothetical protein
MSSRNPAKIQRSAKRGVCWTRKSKRKCTDRSIYTVMWSCWWQHPSFAASATGAALCELAQQYGIPLHWHCGFQLAVPAVPDDFRGPAMTRLARRIAGIAGTLDAAVIGRAAASLHQEPEAWQDWGSRDDTLQHLKQLWHVLVQYGSPFCAGGSPANCKLHA